MKSLMLLATLTGLAPFTAQITFAADRCEIINRENRCVNKVGCKWNSRRQICKSKNTNQNSNNSTTNNNNDGKVVSSAPTNSNNRSFLPIKFPTFFPPPPKPPTFSKRVRVCNKTNSPIYTATFQLKGFYESRGWYKVTPGRCILLSADAIHAMRAGTTWGATSGSRAAFCVKYDVFGPIYSAYSKSECDSVGGVFVTGKRFDHSGTLTWNLLP